MKESEVVNEARSEYPLATRPDSPHTYIHPQRGAGSAQPCGCDSGINHLCEFHTAVRSRGGALKAEYHGDVIKSALTQEDYEKARSQEAAREHDTRVIAERQTLKTQTEVSIDELTRVLRDFFPHGHQSFLPITVRELDLHSRKNADYAGGGPALGNFMRVAAILAAYPHLDLGDPRVVALVYMMKQVDAVLWGISEKIKHKVEGLEDRLQDVAVYANLVICMEKDRAKG